MKQKKYFMLAAAAALFAACSSDDLSVEKQAVAQDADDGAIAFSAYLNRGTTRAGLPGTLTTAGSSANAKNQSLQTTGFGVFAYYGNGEPYSENAKPDFMYNQRVSGADWSYTPVKYWPNEFGSDAISEGVDRLTFFAYAPYVEVDLATGIATAGTGEEEKTGIIALTRNTTHGDPFVKYYADFNPEKRVDLCWGVAKTAFTNSVSGVTSNEVAAGEPFINVVKPKVNDKINFNFKHALAALNVTIDADVDLAGHGTQALHDLTKIWVRSITFEGFTDKGMLNLNGSATDDNYVPEWYDLSGNNKIGSGSKTTIYDGRRDGSEPLGTVSNETPAALNPQIVQSEVYDITTDPTKLSTATSLSGVPYGAPINLFNSGVPTEPIYVIPTDDNLKVTIVYDVETADNHLTNFLADGVVRGSSVENKITKEIKLSTTNLKLQAGKLYTVALHLGMTSVKFDASVTDWTEGTADPTWLPINGGEFAASGSFNFDVPATGGEKQFAVSGLTGTSALAAATDNSVIASSPAPAASDIVGESSTITFTTNSNATIFNRSENITVTETGGGGTTTTITVNQAAAPIVLTNSGITDPGTNKVITLGSTGVVGANADWELAAAKVNWTVVKTTYSGTKTTLEQVASGASDNEFVVTGTGTNAATITLGTAAAVGDVYSITCEPVNGAAAETTVVKVGGVLFTSFTPAVAVGATVSNPVTVIGEGTVAYSSGTTATANFDDASKPVVKGVAASATAATITATLTPSGTSYTYLGATSTATYDIYVADIAVGGTSQIAYDLAAATNITVCGLANTSVINNCTTAATWLTINSSSAVTNSIATINFTPTANDTGAERTATVTINGRQIYIKQAANP